MSYTSMHMRCVCTYMYVVYMCRYTYVCAYVISIAINLKVFSRYFFLEIQAPDSVVPTKWTEHTAYSQDTAHVREIRSI